MPARISDSVKSRTVKSGRIHLNLVRQAEASLQDLPEKKNGLLSLQEAIHQLREPLKMALSKGYTYQELVNLLLQKGIAISESTLKNYLASGRHRISKNGDSGQPTHRNLEQIVEKSNSTVEELVPSRIDVSSYNVGQDFWAAYQASLQEREEVYRRLAQS